MHIYYTLWKLTENRFNEPVLYDYSFPVRFPNVVFRAKDLNGAREKIKAINNKIEKIDRFDSNYSRILKQTLT
jgi:hypothetical protein